MCRNIRKWLKDNKLMLIEADNSRAACIIEMEVRNEPSYIEVKKDYFHEVINNVKKIT